MKRVVAHKYSACFRISVHMRVNTNSNRSTISVLILPSWDEHDVTPQYIFLIYKLMRVLFAKLFKLMLTDNLIREW